MVPITRVAVLGLNYAPEPTGIAPYTRALSSALPSFGYQVTANVAHPHYPEWTVHPGFGQWRHVEICSGVEVRRYKHWIPNPPQGVRRLLSEITFGVRLLFASWGPHDVVIAVSPALFSTALASLRPRRRPFVVWVQDVYTLGLSETRQGGVIAGRVTKWVESRTLRRADRVVAIHPRIADYLINALGVDAKRVLVIRNWTHLPPSKRADRTVFRQRLGWPPDRTVVLHAGNMGTKQGLENVVQAARLADERSEPVQFVLLGNGADRSRLVSAAKGIERISFVDSLPEDEFCHALSGADVLLVNELPGVAEMAVPSKLTSYFDAGRPIVAATDPNGITASEVAAAGAGLTVAAGEPESLLEAVLALRQDPESAEVYGINGRRYRETVLDQKFAIRQWSDLLATL